MDARIIARRNQEGQPEKNWSGGHAVKDVMIVVEELARRSQIPRFIGGFTLYRKT